MDRAPLLSETLPRAPRDALRHIRAENNNPDIIRLRTRADVDSVVNQVRRGSSVTEDMTIRELQTSIAASLVQERQRLREDNEALRNWREGPQPGPTILVQQWPQTPLVIRQPSMNPRCVAIYRPC